MPKQSAVHKTAGGTAQVRTGQAGDIEVECLQGDLKLLAGSRGVSGLVLIHNNGCHVCENLRAAEPA